jgi:cell division cycle protein 37
MLARILDEVNKKLNKRHIGEDERYNAFVEEIGVQIGDVRDLQDKAAERLNELEKQDAKKITSESYHVGFDSSHVNNAKLGEGSIDGGKLELLNPNYDLASAGPGTISKVTTDVLSNEEIQTSDTAKLFVQIKQNDYKAIHAFISSHPEILRESESDSLLIEAFNVVLDHDDEPLAWRYVHHAILLQWCRRLGRDSIAMFFKKVASPGHQAREVFEKDIDESFQRIRKFARENGKQRSAETSDGVEQIQLHAIDPGTSIQISVPEAESEDVEVQKARAIFDGFTPEMKAALESGLLTNVNEVLGTMEVSEAETMVGLLGDVSVCPWIRYPSC